jgi:hypothetical protein
MLDNFTNALLVSVVSFSEPDIIKNNANGKYNNVLLFSSIMSTN